MSPERILVVDDEEGMTRAVERVLGRIYDVRTASSAAEALAIAAKFEPDVAVLDIHMPEIDGFALQRSLKAALPALDVIFMTGITHELDAKIIRSIREKAFYFIQKPFDREVLLTIVSRCLDLRRLANENASYVERLEAELLEARHFQQSLLPPRDAAFDGIDLRAAYEPCEHLGGDFYDFVHVAPGVVSFLVADVCGHGVSAAMLTGIVKSAFHDAHAEGYAPQAVVERIDSSLKTFDDARFITAFVGRIDLGRSELTYVNAGHPPTYVWSENAARSTLKLTRPMITPAMSGLPTEQATIGLATGTELLLLTDGIEERRGPDGLFGEARLLALLDDAEPDSDLTQCLRQALATFGADVPRDDDWTLLHVRLPRS